MAGKHCPDGPGGRVGIHVSACAFAGAAPCIWKWLTILLPMLVRGIKFVILATGSALDRPCVQKGCRCNADISLLGFCHADILTCFMFLTKHISHSTLSTLSRVDSGPFAWSTCSQSCFVEMFVSLHALFLTSHLPHSEGSIIGIIIVC